MASGARSAGLAAAVVATVVVAAACTDEGSRDAGDEATTSGHEVTSEVVSSDATQDMLVFAPEGEGSWPVIVALHGTNGTAEDMAETATRLAGAGSVVFAPSYRTDIGTRRGLIAAVTDIECGYRFARSIAAEHGGDLDRPVTLVGWSLGAIAAVNVGLTEDIDPTGRFLSCFGEVPRPDVVVGISGCYYESAEGEQDFVEPVGFANEGAAVTLLGGGRDTNCAAWQSDEAAAELRSAGYEVDLVRLEGADHFAPIFHEARGAGMVVSSDEPAGDRTVNVILDAVARAGRR